MKTLKFIVIAALSITLTNCGGKEEKKKDGFSYEKSSASETKEEVSNDANVVNLVLFGDDLMKFDKNELKVKAGQKVKLTLRHKGKLDLNVMGHNVVILKNGVDVNAFAGKAATSKDTGYIPEGSEGDVIAHTEMIGGGQTTSIEFDAPAPGTYDFICSFPGHSGLMKGKFIVE